MLDPEKLLGQLGSSPGLSKSGGPAATVASRYCSFCWCTLPSEVNECPDCGRTLEEMEQERKAIAAMDANWIPPQRANNRPAPTPPASTMPVPPEPNTPGSPMPEPVAEELRKTRNHFLVAVVVGSAWGGAVMVAAYVTIMHPGALKGGLTAPPAPNPAINAPAPPPVNAGGNTPSAPGNTPGAPETPVIQVSTLVPVQWPAVPKGMVVKLARIGSGSKKSPGKTLVSTNPKTNVEAGDYKVTYTTSSAKWSQADGKLITGKAGAPLVVPAPSPEVQAKYYLWLGMNAYYPTDLPKAEEAIRQAIQLNPRANETHLQLSGVLVQEGRFKDALAELQTVLDRDPANESALQLKTELEKAAREFDKKSQKPEAKP